MWKCPSLSETSQVAMLVSEDHVTEQLPAVQVFNAKYPKGRFCNPFTSITQLQTTPWMPYDGLLRSKGKSSPMKQAIVCLSHMRHDLLGKVFEILNGYEVDVFQSVDDGFEQLWQDGSDVEIVLLQMTEHHVQELWDTALNWPEIRFIAVFVEEEDLLLRPLPNMSIIVSDKPLLLVEDAINDFVQSR